MKTSLILGGIVITLAAVAIYWKGDLGTTIEYQKEVIEKEIEIHPDWASDTDAVEAAQAVIRRKELEAQENALQGQISALQAELDEVQKELGTY